MSRPALLSVAAFLVPLAAVTFAEEPASPPPPTLQEEVRAIHQLLDQQSKQLDVLAREIAQLNLQLERHHQPPPQPHGEPPAPAAEPSAPPTPGKEAPPHPEAPAHTAEAPKAEPATAVGGAPKHTVAKGETLTSIAKHYNIPVTELQKANKIQDERKLQIGQVLTIPTSSTPSTKSPEPTTDKKENP